MDHHASTNGHGAWALVTGASSGIGAAIAAELAKCGFRLVLVARRAEALDDLAQTLRAAHATEAFTLALDLSDPQSPRQVFEFTQARGIEVEVLVNNAGSATHGEFRNSDLAAQLAMVQLNCVAVLQLSHWFVRGMVERRRGRILIVATTTLAPAAYLTTYASTKGFDLLFAEGLAEEVARHGVTVSALCPGPTRTGMVVEPQGETGQHHLQSAEEVATRAVAGLLRGQRYIRPSWAARLVANMPRLLPRATVSGITEHYYRP